MRPLRACVRAPGAVLSLLALAALARASAAAPPAGAEIEVWVRADAKPEHLRARRFKLDRLPLVERERLDAQYGDTLRYRGIGVRELVDRYAPDKSLDLAILHFANGMAVPLPFRDAAAMKRLDPLVARAWRPARGGRFRASGFPTVSHADASGERRPIEFSGNKLVVADVWHPEVPPSRQSEFSPWAHTDTLTGIELVTARSYYAQFDPGGAASVQRGLTLFRQHCQYCHGVRHVGASFGWDFVDAPAIRGYRDSAAHLYHNVALKPRNAGQLGLMMPALPFLAEADVAAIRDWLAAIADRPGDAESN